MAKPVKEKSIKEKIEKTIVYWIGLALIVGFTGGIGAAAWYHENNKSREIDSLNNQITSLNTELERFRSEKKQADKQEKEKHQKTIQVLNSPSRAPIVATIQKTLTDYANCRTMGILVSQNHVLDAITAYANLQPDLVIAHRHSFETNSSDNLIVNAMRIYDQNNTKINFFIFSESFLYPAGISEFTSHLTKELKDKTTLFAIKDNKDSSNLAPLRDSVYLFLNK